MPRAVHWPLFNPNAKGGTLPRTKKIRKRRQANNTRYVRKSVPLSNRGCSFTSTNVDHQVPHEFIKLIWMAWDTIHGSVAGWISCIQRLTQ
jgi:hypothetical protein